MATSRISVPRAEIAAFCQKHGIQRLALFGSVLRDDFADESDIDVLVEFKPGEEPRLDFFAMEEELAQILGRSVHLNTPGFLSPYFREQVIAEADDLSVAA